MLGAVPTSPGLGGFGGFGAPGRPSLSSTPSGGVGRHFDNMTTSQIKSHTVDAVHRETKGAGVLACLFFTDHILATLATPTNRKRHNTLSGKAQYMRFRVHWGVLAQSSPVFRDMQRLPQPPDESSVDGCAVVQLLDDTTDVEYLLKALYEPTFTRDALPLPAVGALIRLARKYRFDDLLKLALARLTTEFPTTLEEFDALPQEILQIFTDQPGAEFDLIVLASENNMLSALPSVYYCSILSNNPDDLFEFFEKEDVTIAALSPLHLRRCVVGQQRLLMRQFQKGYTLGWVLEASTVTGCTAPSKCRQTREMFMRQCLDEARIVAFDRVWNLNHWKFCPKCNLHATEKMGVGRVKVN
ncbi:hypothetical protein C8R45DRAFT_1204291 [Mycena sanguinolenta]|nr:hypothetical protein C8R45DRAFT_1204291 [Mycena sanguinolenta]